MSLTETSTSIEPEYLWKVPGVAKGLESTQKLLQSVLEWGPKSQNHSLKAQHLLSRGIEILVSVQLCLNSGGEDLLKILQVLDDLQATENVLTESIGILGDEAKQGDSPPCDQAVMSSWHLNRNALTAKLQELPETGSKTRDARWTTVMKDVVRADDLTFATRLCEEVQEKCTDQRAKDVVQNIVSSLESTEDETARTESILGIMCVADASKGTGLESAVFVVEDMAKQLNEPKGEKWKSASERLHELPVCRKVEKPLLLHQGTYPISAIIEDVQTEILLAGASIGKVVPLETEDLDTKEYTEGAIKHVSQINNALVEATRNLQHLSTKKKKSFEEVRGAKTERQILYSTMRLLGDTALSLAPVLPLTEFKKELDKVTTSVSSFVHALTGFEGGPDGKWKNALNRTLNATSEQLKAFAELKVAKEEENAEEGAEAREAAKAKASEAAKAAEAAATTAAEAAEAAKVAKAAAKAAAEAAAAAQKKAKEADAAGAAEAKAAAAEAAEAAKVAKAAAKAAAEAAVAAETEAKAKAREAEAAAAAAAAGKGAEKTS
ncbi:hypothetical protein FRC01_001202 [Tulasnella sp. 417]|nr:hypothetical protein FRC01_001202 [Tulasnella sp. 417]